MTTTKISTRFGSFFQDEKRMFWLGFFIVLIYLMPLFLDPLYVSIFDNLDSTIPILKILAHSGKIFASNHEIIPNMMNGLPRSSYGSEYNVMLWLYYFFTPKTAYIINQIAIHFVAYFSMHLFLKTHALPQPIPNRPLIILAGSLYFALLPFFSPEGLTIPLLPMVTLVLLDIKHHHDTRWHWVFLLLMPLYASFVFLYVFYIPMVGVYLLWDTVIQKRINWRFLSALVLMGIMFLLKEYRLVMETFLGSGFVSHRIEFNKFFVDATLDAFRKGHSFFLNGHAQHLVDLQMPFLIPFVMIAMLLSLSNRHFNQNESMIIWILAIVSYGLNVWPSWMGGLYSIPLLFMYALIIYLFAQKDVRYLPLLFLLQLLYSMFMFFSFCQCGEALLNYFPILKEFNISRFTFVQPLIWSLLLCYSIKIYFIKLHYTFWFVILFLFAQVYLEFEAKEFSHLPTQEYESFKHYYNTKSFRKVKQSIKQDQTEINSLHRVVSFGLEPAISLYNGLYTVDGYITNYPLSYKKKFRKVVKKFLDTISIHNNYDEWGSKVYLMGVISLPQYYQKGIIVHHLPFDIEPLCSIGAEYIISAYEFDTPENNRLKLRCACKTNQKTWDIYLYRILCNQKD